jgi:GNAT superfamily N-acetyltransferase
MKYYAFETLEVGTAVIGLEKLEDMQSDPILTDLHREHYEETETLYLAEEFDPDWGRYILSEKEGQFVVFTARIFGKLVGYLQYYIFRDMHTKSIFSAREDAFFITKSQRGREIAPSLLGYAEHCLKQLGCSHVGMTSKAPCGGPDIGNFLAKKGYKPVATYYLKDLDAVEDEDNVLQRTATSP